MFGKDEVIETLPHFVGVAVFNNGKVYKYQGKCMYLTNGRVDTKV